MPKTQFIGNSANLFHLVKWLKTYGNGRYLTLIIAEVVNSVKYMGLSTRR